MLMTMTMISIIAGPGLEAKPGPGYGHPPPRARPRAPWPGNGSVRRGARCQSGPEARAAGARARAWARGPVRPERAPSRTVWEEAASTMLS